MTTYNLETSGWFTYGSSTIHCKSLTFNEAAAAIAVSTDGFPTPVVAVSLEKRPSVRFISEDVDGVLTALGLLANAVTSNAVTLYFQSLLNEGVRGGDGTHTKMVISAGVVFLEMIEGGQGVVSSIAGTVYADSSDGFTAPVTVSEQTQALPAQTSFTNVCTLGACSLNGTALTNVKSFSINLNNTPFQEISDGNYYPTQTVLISNAPVITVVSENPSQIRSIIGDKALTLATGGLVLTLQDTAAGVVNSTTAHTFTINNGLAVCSDRIGNQGSVVQSGFVVHCAKPSPSTAAIALS